MSWHFLQGQEVASWEATSSDGAPAVLSNMIPTREVSCSLDNETDCCPDSPSGMTLRTFDGFPWRGSIDVCSGGFPCQDIASCGNGAGITGEKSGLWSEMARIVCEVRPRFVFVENSPMLTSRGLGVVLGDLAAMGYDARWCVLGAHHVGAPHKRDRIWILASDPHSSGKPVGSINDEASRMPGVVADTNSLARTDGGKRKENAGADRRRGCDTRRGNSYDRGRSVQGSRHSSRENMADTNSAQRKRDWGTFGISAKHTDASSSSDDAMADTPCERLERSEFEGSQRKEGPGVSNFVSDPCCSSRHEWWEVEPDICRLVNGLASRVDRLKALGNGQVPAVAVLAWQTLMAGFAFPTEQTSGPLASRFV